MSGRADRRRRWRLALVAAPLLAATTACASLPQPSPEAAPTGPRPAVLPAQVALLLPEVEAAVEAAEAANDPALAQGRLTGPAQAALTARATIRSRTQQAGPEADPAEWEALAVVSPRIADYPAFALVAAQVPGRAVPSLLVLTTPSARDPYALYSEMQLLPGAALPATAPASEGSELLAADADGFVAPPAEALARYADVLTKGPESQHAAGFADDSFRQQALARRDADRAALAEVADVTTQYAPVADRVFAVRAEDGSALVVGELTATTRVALRPGAGTARVEADLAALAGRAEFGSAFTTTSAVVVALVVPAAEDADAVVTAVAAQQDVVGVEGS